MIENDLGYARKRYLAWRLVSTTCTCSVALRLFAHWFLQSLCGSRRPTLACSSCEAPMGSARGCTHKAAVSVAVQYMTLEVNCGNCLHSCRAKPRKHLSIEDDWRA